MISSNFVVFHINTFKIVSQNFVKEHFNKLKALLFCFV